MTSTAVRVGLRVRPLTQKEELTNCTECITFIPNEPQILVGTDKSFTYDYVFNTESEQKQVYETSASPLLEKFIEGFNATILAYGQTGSGKTFSMGTGLESSVNPEHEGIVPRCIVDLFRNLEERSESNSEFNYEVYVSFLELYNEELIDLLSPQLQQQAATNKRRSGVPLQPVSNNPVEVTIREDIAGNIYWSGVREERCYNPEELLSFLSKGSLCRTTGSTEMNTVSSRSHAVFSVILKQQKSAEEPSITSKFHFVDLAGSERLKRTNAQGDRAKEGISINSGLLALGNVISALGDEARRTSHVPYRDSKLTRLLQDSLGGNSQTLMLACVSPSDSNFMETLNTLKYANRARNIKNRVTINQDFAGSSIEVNQLRAQLARLRIELASVRAENAGSGDHRTSSRGPYHHSYGGVGSSHQRDDEVRALRAEVARLRDRIQDMSTNLIQVTSERDTMVMERELGEFMSNPDFNDEELLMTSRRSSYIVDGDTNVTPHPVKTHPLVAQYQKTISDLTNELSDTRDRLAFLESTKSAGVHAMASAAATTTPMSFSGTTFHRPEQSFSSSSRRRHGASSGSNRTRRNRRSKTSSASSSTVTSNVTVRKSGKRAVRHHPVLSQSSSLRTSRNNNSNNKHRNSRQQPHDAYDEDDEFDQDEGFVNEDGYVNEDEIKQSIAKAKAEIQKGMEVLDLIKPMEEAAQSWEDELEAFEKAEKELYEKTSHIERSESDEGNYTSTSSPIDDGQRENSNDLDLMLEIEALSVPTWDHKSTTTNKMPRRLLNDEEDNHSSASSASSMHSYAKNEAAAATAAAADKQNPQMVRMLHQIQSDIRVKEELVSHLEKSETKYSFMRRKFDDKIAELHAQLAELQKDRDHALAKTKSTFAAAPNRADMAMQLKEKQQLIETRHVYENKMKQLVMEIHDLKRNYSRTIMNMQSTRNQHESLLRSLRVNVETLKVEKKRMIKRMKQETERVREQMALQERKISKMQRQYTEANHAKTRLEREHEAQKLTLKRREKEIVINNSQLKQLTDMLKKAVREGGMLDDQLLGKVSHIMGGSFAAVVRRGGMRNLPGFRQTRKRKNPIPVHVRVERKKQLLDKMLYQFIQGKQAIVEMEQVLFRRERLASEKLELLEERKSIYMAEKETADLTGEPMDMLAIDLADERIDLIEAEISYLSARIRALQSEAAGEADDMLAQSPDSGSGRHQQEKRKVTFADEIVSDPVPNDEWADMDALEEQFNVPSNAAPELVYDVTIKLLKTLEADECRSITEALVDDITNARMSECNRQMTMQNLEKTVQDLRRTLIVMKRAAIATTVENERRIRKLEEKNNGVSKTGDSIDNKIEDYIMNSGNTIFDKIYEDGLRGMIGTPEPDYILNESPDEASVSTASYERRSSTQSEGLMPPPSPLTLPAYTASTATNNLMLSPTRPPTSTGVRAPASLSDKGGVMRVNNSNYPTRDSTPSPDRFYNMIQKRLSWQQRVGGSESPIPMTMVNPAEFSRYANDRESSTSSIHSGHLRRASLQSDFSSSQNSYNNTNGSSGPPTVSSTQSSLRKRAFSVQQPPVQAQQLQYKQASRRASLRELSLKGTNGSPMTHSSSSINYMSDYDHEPTATMSFQRYPGHQQQQLQQQQQALKRPPLVSMSTLDNRSTTPNGGNVFARLSQTPTRASQAKISHRHSSSSMDELRMRWELERTPSAMSGSYYGD
ncbi:kinesin-like protein KIF21A-like [Mucor ambiguus]|uniref:Kinesin-like protein KIF21A-like n=1 Tax=Mucor ambiguus TaxID=91626 RepID=A0A0C9LUN4_9FUNG|nr:kinesin-like protein KIF21A-like [Mucor ambiguus]